MSWMNELYKVYELTTDALPISHSTAKAQIEVMIDERGNFMDAGRVNKDEAETIIPVTEDSGARRSDKSPHPFADDLEHIAGDYKKYACGKDADNSKLFDAYIKQLKSWQDDEHSHPAVSALYEYLEKKVLMEDLVKKGILEIDSETSKLPPKIDGTELRKIFVRFVVSYDDENRESRTWLDKSLYSSFIEFNSGLLDKKEKELCYVTGKEMPPTYKHPGKIRNDGDKANLISANDKEGFTYRGRFINREEAFSVSYDASQKIHNALKWLIRKQGRRYGSLVLVTWASALEKLPDELQEWEDEETYDSLPAYKSWLKDYIMKYERSFKDNTKVMIMGLDAATTGRLSIALYDELQGSHFLENLKKWHEITAFKRRYKGDIKSFGLYEIVNAAYGEEQKDRFKDHILRLLPCVTNGLSLPRDIVQTLYYRASNPLAYQYKSQHDRIIEAACGMYRAWKGGNVSMEYDPQETNRSYLYGCLLAIADKAESDTYEENDKNERITNARRYWANFAQHPYQTWQHIEERLRPYLDRHKYRANVERQIQEIMNKFTPEVFADNSHLETMYLLGYHHYMSHMYKKKEDNKEDNNGDVATQD